LVHVGLTKDRVIEAMRILTTVELDSTHDFEALNELLSHIFTVLDNNKKQLKHSIRTDIIDSIIFYYKERLPFEVRGVINKYFMLVKLSYLQAERETKEQEVLIQTVNIAPVKQRGRPRLIKPSPNGAAQKTPELLKTNTVLPAKPKSYVPRPNSASTSEFRNAISQLITIEDLLPLTYDKLALQDSREVLHGQLIRMIIEDRDISELSNQQIAYRLYQCLKTISRDNEAIELFNKIDWRFLLNDFNNLSLNIPLDENGEMYSDDNIIKTLFYLRNYQRVPPYQHMGFQNQVKRLIKAMTGIDLSKSSRDERAYIIVRLGRALQRQHELLRREGHTQSEYRFDLVCSQINWDFLVEAMES